MGENDIHFPTEIELPLKYLTDNCKSAISVTRIVCLSIAELYRFKSDIFYSFFRNFTRNYLTVFHVSDYNFENI